MYCNVVSVLSCLLPAPGRLKPAWPGSGHWQLMQTCILLIPCYNGDSTMNIWLATIFTKHMSLNSCPQCVDMATKAAGGRVSDAMCGEILHSGNCGFWGGQLNGHTVGCHTHYTLWGDIHTEVWYTHCWMAYTVGCYIHSSVLCTQCGVFYTPIDIFWIFWMVCICF